LKTPKGAVVMLNNELFRPLLVVGGGNMGASMIKGILAQGVVSPNELKVVEPDVQRAEQLRKQLEPCKVYTSLLELQTDSSVLSLGSILFAVKPQVAAAVCIEYASVVTENTLILSCMAGISERSLRSWCFGRSDAGNVIRFMPNLPAQIGKSMTVYHFSENCGTKSDLAPYQHGATDFACQLFESFGKALQVKDEVLLNSATAIAGSGTGYLAYIFEHYVAVAQELGFTYEQASLLVKETVMGAVLLWDERNVLPQQILKEVTSPGGTTAAAVAKFVELHLGESLQIGIKKAFERSKELEDF
jgi:pyrroline-5-carboxylate reductase